MSGNEAIARGAYEAGVRFAAAYPGTPSTEIMEQFCKYEGVYAEWSTNEKVAVEVMKERKGIDVCANVDYYSGYVYSLLGIENDLFTPLFAISRTAGWVSHHLENRQSNRKLIRPANVYVGGMEENE